MPEKSPTETLNVDLLTRVEGEGALEVWLDGGEVRDVRLKIFEPPRFFEGFLRGRHYSEVPDIVARICGICPVAYQMSAVHALERIFGTEIDPEVRRLRRLLYCGEWIESHALHVYMLHAPDFLDADSALELAGRDADLVRRGIRLKRCGDRILRTLGGRAVHPVSVRVGGFSRVPTKDELAPLAEELAVARDDAIETVRWVAGFELPGFHPDYTFASLTHPGEYPMNAGEVTISGARSARFADTDFERHLRERQIPYTHALQCTFEEKSYLTGPLARLNHNHARLSPTAAGLLAGTGLRPPLTNPYAGIVARALEILHAVEEALEIVESYAPPAAPAAEVTVRAGEASAVTEAPRGMLHHRYRVGADGLVEEANIVPPTSQNQARIEADLAEMLPALLARDREEATRASERLIRCYDPCISCATHFLRLEVRS